MTNTGPTRFTIADDEAGQALEAIVQSRLGVLADDVIAHGGVWLDGRRAADMAQSVPLGSQIILNRPPDGQYAQVVITSEDIVYEDSWLLALNKRQGWYCGIVPWDLYGNALASLGVYLRLRDGGTPYLHMAHQLDRDTSGILIFSRSPESNAPLHAAFRDHTARKSYICICAGIPPEGDFEVQTGHGRASAGRFQVYPLEDIGKTLPGGSHVKSAHTRFTTRQLLDGAAVVEAHPLSGRTHQIRLHLAHLGYPLLGDTRYGGPERYAGQLLSGHMLHAAELTIPHPGTREPFTLNAPLPSHFLSVLGDASIHM